MYTFNINRHHVLPCSSILVRQGVNLSLFGFSVCMCGMKGFAVIPNPRNGRSFGHGIYLSPLTNTVQSMGYSHPDTNGATLPRDARI